VADLENRHADAGQRQEVALNFLQNRHRHDRWTGRKIEHALYRSHHESLKTIPDRRLLYQLRAANVAGDSLSN
jgi:hypothetical protein